MSGPILSHAIQFLGVTFALVAGIILIAFITKKMNLQKFAGKRGFTVVASQSIGTREKIILVQFAGKNLLVGVVPGAISLLGETENPIAIQKPAGRFQSILQKEQAG